MRKLWVDPPQGWRYGFPKVWDATEEPDCNAWMIKQGYPEGVMKSYGDFFYSRMWDVDKEEEE